MAYGDVLLALADPTRRRLYERLRRRPHSVGELARFTRITQPGASQHLRVLRKARLVAVRQHGARRFYEVVPEGVDDLRRYVSSLWDDVLKAYAAADSAPPRGRPAGRGRLR